MVEKAATILQRKFLNSHFVLERFRKLSIEDAIDESLR